MTLKEAMKQPIREWSGWFLLSTKSDWIRWLEIEHMDSQCEPTEYPAFAQATVDGGQWSSPQYIYTADAVVMAEMLKAH